MIEFSVRKPVTIFMICLAIVLFGAMSINKIPMQLLPEYSIPEFKIITVFKGANPEEVEELITIPLERSLSTIGGLKSSSSISKPERSEIHLSFSNETNIIETISLIKDRIDSTSIPEEAIHPKIERFISNSGPIMIVAISSERHTSLTKLARELNDDLVKKIEKIDGVAEATIKGNPSESIEIKLNAMKVKAFAIDLPSIPALIKENNKMITTGTIQVNGKTATVRMGNKIDNIEEIKNLIVKSDGTKTLRLKDIAEVIETEKKNESISFHQGKESLLLEIRKEASGNAVEVNQKAIDILKQFSEKEKGLHYEVIIDQGKKISDSIYNVVKNVIEGGFFSALVIFLFLQSATPTIIILTAIPLSLFFTLISMYFFNITFNLMSLAGLALGIGMLMDNSVVVLNSINLYRKKFDSYAEAAITGTKKVSSAITASTLTSSSVFIPLCFIDGNIGHLFKDIAFTVILSLLSSLIVALTVVPMLSAIKKDLPTKSSLKLISLASDYYLLQKQFFKWSWYLNYLLSSFVLFWKWPSRLILNRQATKALKPQVLREKRNQFFQRINNAVNLIEEKILLKTQVLISKKNYFILKSIAILIGSVLILLTLGAEFSANDNEQLAEFDIDLTRPRTIEETEKIARQIFSQLSENASISNATIIGNENDHQHLTLFVYMPTQKTELTKTKKELKQKINLLPDVFINEKLDNLFSPERPISVDFYSDDIKQSELSAFKLFSELKQNPHFVNLKISPHGKVDLFTIDFKLNKLDYFEINAFDFINTLRNELSTLSAGLITFNNMEKEIFVSNELSTKKTSADLNGFNIERNGKPIYLSDVAELRSEKTNKEIYHKNRKNTITLSSDLVDLDPKSANQLIHQMIQDKKIISPTGHYQLSGGEEERKNNTSKMAIAISISLFLIYLLLSSQFESFLRPLIILIAAPLSLIGIAIVLLILGMKVNAMVFVGIIILGGISVNTSIVMVDSINQHIEEGLPLKIAILKGTKERIRPILMSTLSNVLALIPMLFASGTGEMMRKSLAITIMGGLLSSTALTIFIIPIVYISIGTKTKYVTS